MKTIAGVILAAASISAGAAQPDWGLKGNQYGFAQASSAMAAPANSGAARDGGARKTSPDRQCVLESALLQKVASMRDLGVRQSDAERIAGQDAARGNSYSVPFISKLSKQTDWIYRHESVTQSEVQMAYLRQCDPQYFDRF